MGVRGLRDSVLLAENPVSVGFDDVEGWAFGGGIRQVGAEWHFPRARGHRCVMALLNGPGGSGSGGGYV